MIREAMVVVVVAIVFTFAQCQIIKSQKKHQADDITAVYQLGCYLRQKRAVEKGYARYNEKTGKLEWLDKDVQYVITGEINE